METVTDLNTDTINGIKKLVAINRDAAKGFRKAAEILDESPAMSTQLSAYGNERDIFANELADALRLNDEDIPDSSALGAAHRWWMGLRGNISSNDMVAVLDEACRGESAAIDRYTDVIRETTGNPLNGLLHKQMQRIVEVSGRIEAKKSLADD